ncbi:M23 family metallopeptidase [Microbacterium azadirachtae]|uniref:murein hydrolase activator EnvC family protein n=1 Tax=Microbacterium azadirachtae TaxID=582680 RepID=UPI0021D4F693|nr:M23 family metallopeptidase [Microbacterium azadirachtae]UXW87425.1 M23 family metallopeptidase [Microbacterium azadirachtae]
MSSLLRSPDTGPPRWVLALVAALLGALVPLLGPAPAPAAEAADPIAHVGGPAVGSSTRPPLPDGDWLWPVEGSRSVVEPFRAPAHAYGAGHRGVDIAAAGDLRAPADGVVAFAGTVVDRPLLTIDHGNGLVTTFEPATSTLTPGSPVHRGDVVAHLAAGGHAPPGSLHLGVRWNGVYVNPMLLFGDVPRAVLLPCGSDGC